MSFSLPVLVEGGACLLCGPLPLVSPFSCFLFSSLFFSLLFSDCKSVCHLLSLLKPPMCHLCMHLSLCFLISPSFLPPFSSSLPSLCCVLCHTLSSQCLTSTWTLAGVSMPTAWWSAKSSVVPAAFLVSLCCRLPTTP